MHSQKVVLQGGLYCLYINKLHSTATKLHCKGEKRAREGECRAGAQSCLDS